MSIIVPASGPENSDILVVGEGPGRREAEERKPFVGPSGRELERLLSRHGLSSSSWRKTNVVPEYFEGNPDPTPSLISKWRNHLLQEIETCQPKLIIPVGRFAAKWFLGESAELETVRGLPRASQFDPFDFDIPDSLHSAIIIPVTHPAAGLYEDEAGENLKRAQISWDFTSLSYYVKLFKQKQFSKLESLIISNSCLHPEYLDVTGSQLKEIILDYRKHHDLSELAIDTEGDPSDPWSIQISLTPGTGYTLRYAQPDFHIGVSILQELSDSGVTFIMHCASTPGGCMYDILMPRVMGLDLSRAKIIDTMYILYLMRLEARGLKPASLRWCDMPLSPYMDLIGDIGKEKQIKYLQKVADLKLPKPEPMIIDENDGTQRLYRPNSVSSTAASIINDVLSGKVTKEGPTDPFKRWKSLEKFLRKPVESLIGRMPIGSLKDLPLKDAVQYASADPDATFRLKNRLVPEVERLDLVPTAALGMENLPTFEIMQYRGMPASRSRFENLQSLMQRKCAELQHRLSVDYYNGKPINPKSPQQTASLLRRRGLTGNKRTKTGAISTGKKSIEHLRYKDEAIKLVFDWREHFHIDKGFCEPYLEAIPEDVELHNVTSILKPADTETRRLAGEDPNPLNTPTRTEIGRMVRDCFIAPEGFLFLGADLSQIELRVLASLSDSKFLIRAFLNNEDIHTRTAMEVNGISKDEVLADKEKYRTPAKTTNFGIVYGQGDQGLYDELNRLGVEGWDLLSCKKLRKEILHLFGINKWTMQVAADAMKFDYARDLGGMYRYLPNLRSSDNRLVAEAGRHAVSQIVQGTAQTMIQNSMAALKPEVWNLQDNGFFIHWLLQYHDELIFLIEKAIAELAMEIVIGAMTKRSGIKLKVPILAEGHVAKEWGKLK